MTINITMQGIITTAAVVAALATLYGYFSKAHNWFEKQNAQDNEIKAMKSEQQLLVYGVLACLQGLKEQGCNGPVTEAIGKFEKYLNEKAHH